MMNEPAAGSRMPPINLTYVRALTTELGIMQQLTPRTEHIVHTLDNNARALMAMCVHYEQTRSEETLRQISVYLGFVGYCLQPEGYFLNYTDSKGNFTELNNFTNLAEANGRALWALGYVVSKRAMLPSHIISSAENALQTVLSKVSSLHSTRAIAFIIKGLYHYRHEKNAPEHNALIHALADKLAQLYHHESGQGWDWYEPYLACANGVLPDAMLCAYRATGNPRYRDIARHTFDFLLGQMVQHEDLKLFGDSRRSPHEEGPHGEQSLEVCYTILALANFYEVFGTGEYLAKMQRMFAWFMGHNHLNKVLYDENTGACFSVRGKERAEFGAATASSTLAYLLSRLTIQKYMDTSWQTINAIETNQNETDRKQVA